MRTVHEIIDGISMKKKKKPLSIVETMMCIIEMKIRDGESKTSLSIKFTDVPNMPNYAYHVEGIKQYLADVVTILFYKGYDVDVEKNENFNIYVTMDLKQGRTERKKFFENLERKTGLDGYDKIKNYEQLTGHKLMSNDEQVKQLINKIETSIEEKITVYMDNNIDEKDEKHEKFVLIDYPIFKKKHRVYGDFCDEDEVMYEVGEHLNKAKYIYSPEYDEEIDTWRDKTPRHVKYCGKLRVQWHYNNWK